MSKKWSCIWVSFVMMLAGSMTVWASDQRIPMMPVEISYETPPAVGTWVSGVNAHTASEQFQVSGAEYVTEAETWTTGDRPLVKVYLVANSGYRFQYTSKRYFTLSGVDADFKRAQIYDNGAALELEVYLKRIEGSLKSPGEIQWSGTSANWDAVYGASSYEVRLYTGATLIKTVETPGVTYDMGRHMNRAGRYKFRVRAKAAYDKQSGEWSEYSPEQAITKEDADYNKSLDYWVENNHGWWYAYGSGGYPSNSWKLINHAWYYFNGDGYMVTGWHFIDNQWYYMDPASGARLTNWNYIRDKWYYMNEDGVMMTGWQEINQTWYYLGSDGAMYVNTITPDGSIVDETGARKYTN